MVFAPAAEGVNSEEAVAVAGEVAAVVTRDGKGRAGDGNGGVPCRMAGASPDHL